MSSNCYEWSTETSLNESAPWVRVGGICNDNTYLAGRRDAVLPTHSDIDGSFRPIIYL